MINICFFIIPALIAIFFAINMGGSGVSPAFSMTFTAHWLNKKLIPILFGLFIFLGAFFATDRVDITLSRGIIPSGLMKITIVTIILFASAISLFIANILKVPQSTSQVIVFSLLGVAIFYKALKPEKLLNEIFPLWMILPAITFLIAYLCGKFLSPVLKKIIPIQPNRAVEKIMQIIGIGTGCYVSFALGSNNVANITAPLISMFANETGTEIVFLADTPIVFTTLIVTSIGFGVGAAIFGKKTMETTGKNITEVTPISSFFISIMTATILFSSSMFWSLPLSLVQMHITAIIGFGISKKGLKETFNNFTIRKILWVWLAAPVISMAITMFLLFITDGLMGRL